jgi:hypothetical protein
MQRACYYIKGALRERLRGSLHLQRIVSRVTEAGPRRVAELLIEVMEGAGVDPAALERLLERWPTLDPEVVRALGADRFPPRPLLRIVPKERGR